MNTTLLHEDHPEHTVKNTLHEVVQERKLNIRYFLLFGCTYFIFMNIRRLNKKI